MRGATVAGRRFRRGRRDFRRGRDGAAVRRHRVLEGGDGPHVAADGGDPGLFPPEGRWRREGAVRRRQDRRHGVGRRRVGYPPHVVLAPAAGPDDPRRLDHG